MTQRLSLVDRLAAKAVEKQAAFHNWQKSEIRQKVSTLPDKVVEAYLKKRAQAPLSPEQQQAFRALAQNEIKLNGIMTSLRSLKLEDSAASLGSLLGQLQQVQRQFTASSVKEAQPAGLSSRLIPKAMNDLSGQYQGLVQLFSNFPRMAEAIQNLAHGLKGAAGMVQQQLQSQQAPQPLMQRMKQQSVESPLQSIHWARLHLDRALQVTDRLATKPGWTKMVGSLKVARTELLDLRKVQVEAARAKKRKMPAIGHDPWKGRRQSFDSAFKKIDGARGQLARLVSRLGDGSLVSRDVQYAMSMLEKCLEAMKRC